MQAAYSLVVFLTAGGALVLEIVAGRLIAPYVGMSLYTWTAIIAVVLAGLTAGHWIGGRLAGAGVGARAGHLRIAVSLAAAAVSALATLPLLRLVAGALQRGDFGPIGTVVALTSALFLLPSLFVGIVSPIATKLAIDEKPGDTGPVLGRMFAAGAFGSIIGTLASGYLFIAWIGTVGTVQAVSALYAVLAIGFAVLAKRGRAVAGTMLLAAALVAGWAQAAASFRSPCTAESDYFCIRIDDFSGESGRESRLMVLDHLVHSINDRTDPGLLYSPYLHFTDELARLRFIEPAMTAAFFIGGGGYTLPRAWQKNFPSAKLTVAELDPVVTRVATEQMWLHPNEGTLNIVHRDARTLLQGMPPGPHFDVVFGDAFHDIAVPSHLVTDEFAAVVAARMSPRGFYAINTIDQAENPMFMFALVKTLKKHFETVEVWVESEVSKQAGRVTFIVLSMTAPSSASSLAARHGIVRGWLRWPPENLAERIASADPPVLTDRYAPVERLLAPSLAMDIDQ